MRDEFCRLSSTVCREKSAFLYFNFSLRIWSVFANSKNVDETWQAKRVMERIKFWLKLHLEGENRRWMKQLTMKAHTSVRRFTEGSFWWGTTRHYRRWTCCFPAGKLQSYSIIVVQVKREKNSLSWFLTNSAVIPAFCWRPQSCSKGVQLHTDGFTLRNRKSPD